jgi:5-carboxyvanillate decarboxylase
LTHVNLKLYYNQNLFSPIGQQVEESLLDIGEGRLKHMDSCGIDVQVISLTNPSVQIFNAAEGDTWAQRTNDELSEVIRKYPGRFVGLAAAAPQNPEKAAGEIERAVTKLGLKGVCLYSHVDNQ